MHYQFIGMVRQNATLQGAAKTSIAAVNIVAHAPLTIGLRLNEP